MTFLFMKWSGKGVSTAVSNIESSGCQLKTKNPKIYYMDPRLAGPLQDWSPHLVRAQALGFNSLCLPPVFASSDQDVFLASDAQRSVLTGVISPLGEAVAKATRLARANQLSLIADVVLDRVAADSGLARALPTRPPTVDRNIVDPRRLNAAHASTLHADSPQDLDTLTRFWSDRLSVLVESGVEGFRLLGLEHLPLALLHEIRRAVPSAALLAWTPGLTRDRLAALTGVGFDAVFSSTPWWDGRASWYVEEHELLRRIAPVIATVEVPFAERQAERGATHSKRTLKIAAATASGLLMPMGFEFLSRQRLDVRFSTPRDRIVESAEDYGPLASDVIAATGLIDELSTFGDGLRSVTGPGSPITKIQRGDRTLISISPDDVVVDSTAPQPAIMDIVREPETALLLASHAPRIVIENITPRVDGGPFAAKRIVGHAVTVEADVYIDGHDVLDVQLHWRPTDETAWRHVPMTHVGNDRWRASITPDRVGRWTYTIEACLDELATVRRALKLKKDAGVDFSVEATEEKYLAAKGMHRAFIVRHDPLLLDVERTAAGFASWYELFPRSITVDPKKHGTFDDVIGALPRIRDMGFDVLYFPPIHPIGKSHRKGRNNTLTPDADDVGSVYAVGGPDGGHDALHSRLGTLDDFRRLVAAAHDHGLELAIDFAIQCSPDHPWLKQHPDWFRHRPDGTIKYAENPPKKYEDIVNVDFYAEGSIPDLWLALRDVVLFWAKEGVRIFRVDNPHTKPLPFWHWMIADVRGRYPDAMFLSEAFTRPKMMYRLAKVGYSQSYSYFTWRNTKLELTEYLTELSTTKVAEFFRPNFFVNTPDINPIYLQSSGRAGFVIRAVLAATLSGLWGVYSGFEICEAAALPNREEYLDSEKYEIRVRDFDAPGNIVAEITTLNRIRKAQPALQSHLGVNFYNSSNDQVMAYGKTATGHDDMIFTIISLDPHEPQETSYEIPLWHWGLPDNGSLEVEDLMNGQRFTLNGKRQWLRLDPAATPFTLWRIWRAA
jgi:starch synthase (maltosyl-transferring)